MRALVELPKIRYCFLSSLSFLSLLGSWYGGHDFHGPGPSVIVFSRQLSVFYRGFSSSTSPEAPSFYYYHSLVLIHFLSTFMRHLKAHLILLNLTVSSTGVSLNRGLC